MNRPTQKQVDRALRQADEYTKLLEYCPDDPLDVLAAEVKALRADMVRLGMDLGRWLALRARLETFPDNWRACASTVNDPTSPSIFVECAEELERVLNDD